MSSNKDWDLFLHVEFSPKATRKTARKILSMIKFDRSRGDIDAFSDGPDDALTFGATGTNMTADKLVSLAKRINKTSVLVAASVAIILERDDRKGFHEEQFYLLRAPRRSWPTEPHRNWSS